MRFLNKISNTTPKTGSISLFYLAQAGFCIKTSDNKSIYIDPYLSDSCERLFNFKRMIPSLLSPEEVDADFYLVTHHHADHLDPDTIPVIAKSRKTIFIVAPDCEAMLNELNVNENRYAVLNEGQVWQNEEIKVRAIFADHGELAPEAMGFLIEVDGIKIYHAGDTAFRPDQIIKSLSTEIDIMIVPINGQYGNMTASEACKLGELINPEILIPCHFWMFLEHVSEGGKGSPATFLKEAAKLPKSIKGIVMAPGERLDYSV